MTLSVKSSGPGLDKIAAALKATNARVVVGVQDKSERADGITNVELAAIHEYGAPEAGIPARPFIGASFDANKAEYVKQLIGAARQALKAGEQGPALFRVLLGRIGAKMQADTREWIRRGIPPPLEPPTIRAKGSSTPLIDTGQLLRAITFEVRDD